MSSSIDSAVTEEPRLPPGVGWDRAANRRMCAGVYLDHAFRDLVLRSVYCDRNRRVAPSYGFSLIPVVVHAWRAWRLELAQHVIVLAIFVAAAFRAWPDAVIALSVLTILYVGGRLLPLAGEFASYYGGRKSFLEFEKLKSRRAALGYAMLLSMVACAIAIFVELHARLTGRGFGKSWFAHSGLGGSVVILVLIAGVVAAISAIRQVKLGRLHNDNSWRVRARGRRLSVIRAQQAHPFTVYSGFVPFIGSGGPVLTWSFAQRLIHRNMTGYGKDPEYDILPFTSRDLVEHLKKMIKGLRDDENPETRLPGLTVADHVLVEGTHAFPFLPVLRSSAEDPVVRDAVTEVIAHSSDVARHYLSCQVESWGGEIVTTVFVHVSLQGRTLYVEFSTYALLPTRQEYHVVDEVGETGAAAVVRAVGKSLTNLPDVLMALWKLTAVPGELWAALRARKDRTLTARRGVNIGATVSVRESATAGSEESYFQFRDIIQHSKIIERRLIASVGEFLEERGVDTSEFTQRANTILNNSVIIAAGGAVSITGSAVGNQASVGGDSAPPASTGD